ncbi:MAG TPA: cupin-like domain-containing protein [Kofleriaceae bacterium]|nr:cupin-like domain-containing protein [Kofleriaceae bacterium]
MTVSTTPFDRLDAPSSEALQHLFEKPSRPTVITGLVDRWRAYTAWTDAYLEQAAAGSHVDVTVASRTGVTVRTPREKIELGDFMRRLARAEPSVRHYVGGLPLEQVPALLGDVDFDPIVAGRRHQGPNLWAGIAGASSRLHFDATHGCMAMLRGAKRFVLFAPETRASQIYPHPLFTRSPNWSRVVDVDEPDQQRFPGFAGAPRCELVLRAGEMLFIPALWWHTVKGLGVNIGVNVWFRAPLRRFFSSVSGWRSLVHEAFKSQPYLNRLRIKPNEPA